MRYSTPRHITVKTQKNSGFDSDRVDNIVEHVQMHVFVCFCRIEKAVMKSNTTGQVNLLCAQSKVIEMDDGFTGLSFTLQVNNIHLIESQSSNNL